MKIIIFALGGKDSQYEVHYKETVRDDGKMIIEYIEKYKYEEK